MNRVPRLVTISQLQPTEKEIFCPTCSGRLHWQGSDVTHTVKGKPVRKDKQPMQRHLEHKSGQRRAGCSEPLPISRVIVIRVEPS